MLIASLALLLAGITSVALECSVVGSALMVGAVLIARFMA